MQKYLNHFCLDGIHQHMCPADIYSRTLSAKHSVVPVIHALPGEKIIAMEFLEEIGSSISQYPFVIHDRHLTDCRKLCF